MERPSLVKLMEVKVYGSAEQHLTIIFQSAVRTLSFCHILTILCTNDENSSID